MTNAFDAPTNVLVIDDEKGMRDMLFSTLTRQGYRVGLAEDGERGVEKAGAEIFDVVICDIIMPGMGGVETLKLLKQREPAIEVIMTTGYATLETAAVTLALGAFDFITKPYELAALCALLEKAVVRRRGR